MFKEAINNSVKYSECKNIKVDVYVEGTKLIVKLNDDGKGFDTINTKMGNGIKNIKKRAKLAKGEVVINSELHKGTTIKFFGNFSKFRFKDI
jgi:signal transduction histidine kinase